MPRPQLLLLALLLPLFLLAACTPAPALEETQVLYLTLDAHDIYWDTEAFTVRVGQPITLRIANQGALDHDFVLDALELHAHLLPDQVVELAFSFDQPGEYEFYCSIPGHIDAGMTGTFTVLPADE